MISAKEARKKERKNGLKEESRRITDALDLTKRWLATLRPLTPSCQACASLSCVTMSDSTWQDIAPAALAVDTGALVASTLRLSERVLTLAAYQGPSTAASTSGSVRASWALAPRADLVGHVAALCAQAMLLAALPPAAVAVDAPRLASLAAGLECVCILVADASLEMQGGDATLLHELLCWFGALPISWLQCTALPAPACRGGACGGLSDGLVLCLQRLGGQEPTHAVWLSLLEALGHVAVLLTQEHDGAPVQLISSAGLTAACALMRSAILQNEGLFAVADFGADLGGPAAPVGGSTRPQCITVLRRLLLGVVGALCRQAVLRGARGQAEQEAAAAFLLELCSVLYAALAAQSSSVLHLNVEVRKRGRGSGKRQEGAGRRRVRTGPLCHSCNQWR